MMCTKNKTTERTGVTPANTLEQAIEDGTTLEDAIKASRDPLPGWRNDTTSWTMSVGPAAKDPGDKIITITYTDGRIDISSIGMPPMELLGVMEMAAHQIRHEIKIEQKGGKG